MSDEGGRFRRLKAVFRNAFVWGVTWGVLGTTWATLMRLSDSIPFGQALVDGIGMGIRIGIGGGLVGAVFAAIISIAYRGKNLAEISPAKFGLGAAIFSGAFVPAVMQATNLLSGSGFVPFDLINTDILYSALFGGITAAGTMALAKRDARRNPALPGGSDHDALNPGAGAYQDSAARERASSQR